MAITRNVVVLFSANTGLLTAGLANASRQINGFNSSINRVMSQGASGFTKMQAAIAGVGLATVASAGAMMKLAASLETNMRNVNSLAQETEQGFRAMTDEVIRLSTEFPQSADVLAKGLYQLVSSGFEGAEAMGILEDAARAATAGLSDTDIAVEAIAATINAFGLEASESARVSDVLFQTVNYGIITFEELAQELGDVVGTAAAARQSIEQVGAAMATMTLSGLGTDEAAVSLNRVLQAIIKPSGELNAVLQLLGYESGAAALEMKGLNGVMNEVAEVTGDNISSMLRLFPEIRSSRGALALLANEGENYNRIFGTMNDQTQTQGATQRAYTEQLKATSMQFALFMESVRASAIEVGRALLPLAQFAMSDFPGPQVIAGTKLLATSLTSLFATISDNREMIGALAVSFGVVLLPKVIATTVAFASLGRVWGVLKFQALAGGIGRVAASFMQLNPVVRVASIVLTALSAGLAVQAKNRREAEEAVESFTDAIEADSNAIGENVRMNAARMLQDKGLAATAREYGIELSTLTDAALGEADAMQEVIDQINEVIAARRAGGEMGPNPLFDAAGLETGQDMVNQLRGVSDSLSTAVAEAEELEQLVGEDMGDAMGETGQDMQELERIMGSSADQIAADLGVDLDQLEEMAASIKRVQDQARAGIFNASDLTTQFDPRADIAYQNTPEVDRILAVAQATGKVGDAEQALAATRRAVQDSVESIRDAERQLQRAREDVGRVAEDNAQRLVDAYDGVAEAQRNVQDAQEVARQAELALNDARVEAIRLIDEQREKVALQGEEQESGIIAVVRARERLRELESRGGSQLDIREAQIALDQAERSARQMKDTHLDERKALEEMTQAGVEGSDVVLEARERLRDAEEGIADAIKASQKASADLARTQVENADRVVEARRAVADAEGNVTKARQRSAEVAKGVAQAERDLALAHSELAAAQVNMMSTGDRLALFYEEQETAAAGFLEKLQLAVQSGLDPEVAQRLLQAGPEAAMPILEAMLNDHSGRLIGLVNEGEIRLAELADSAAETAVMLEQAVTDAGDEMNARLRTAMGIMVSIGRLGGRATTFAVAQAMRESMDEVSSVSRDFGIAIADSLNPILEAIGEDIIDTSKFSTPVSGRAAPPSAPPTEFAEGGFVSGPRTMKDSVRALLMPHEFVQPVSTVDYYGVDTMEALRSKSIPREFFEGVPKFAAGGRVTGDTQGLNPEFHRRLMNWSAAVGQPYNVGSGYRSLAEQAVLYDRWMRRVPGQAQAAPPGRSNHNFGLASDGPRWRGRNPGAFGLVYPMSYEPWHVEPIGARSMRGGGAGDSGMYGHTMGLASLPEVPSTRSGAVGETASKVMKHVRDAAGAWAAANYFLTYDEETGTFSGGGAGVDASGYPPVVTRWAPQVNEALRMMNESLDNVSSILTIIKYESTGNPRAINNSDINAQRGDPSRGLMQTIGSTFRANRHPSLSEDIYDPLSNIYAGANYGRKRYGSISNIPGVKSIAGGGPYRPYAEGGLVEPTRRMLDKGGVLPRGWSLVGNFTGDLEAFGSSKERRFATGGLVSGSGNAYTPPLAILPGNMGTASHQSRDLAGMQAAIAELERALAIQEWQTRELDDQRRLSEVRAEQAVTQAILEAAIAEEMLASSEAMNLMAVRNRAMLALHDATTDEEKKTAQEALNQAQANFDLQMDLIQALSASRVEAEADNVKAIDAVIEVEHELAIASQQRRIAQEMERLESQARLAANREQYLFDQMSSQEQLDNIREKLAAEQMYTDEWMKLKAQEERIISDMTGERQRAQENFERELDRLLDQYEELTQRAIDVQRNYDEATAEALISVNRAIDQARRQADEALRDIVNARVGVFDQALRMNQKFVSGWGNTVQALIANTRASTDAFLQWQFTIDQLRNRGLSEGVIIELGLDDIANLGDATMLLNATDEQLQVLNDLLAQQQGLFMSRAQREQRELLGQVGQASTEVRAALQEEMSKLWDEYLIDIAEMSDKLDEELDAIMEDIANLGQDTGRTYAERMEQALATGLPAIIAMARQYEGALAAAQRAQEEMDAIAADQAARPPTDPYGNVAPTPTPRDPANPAGLPPYTGPLYGRPQPAAPRPPLAALAVPVTHPSVGGIAGALASLGIASRYDQGGRFKSGTVGVNTSGQDEFVMTLQQLKALGSSRSEPRGAMMIEVHMDGRVIAQTVTEYQHRGNRKIMLSKGRILQGIK